jgi:hypothetical protein
VISTTFGRSPVLGSGTVFYAGSVARLLGELDLGCGDAAAAVPFAVFSSPRECPIYLRCN